MGSLLRDQPRSRVLKFTFKIIEPIISAARLTVHRIPIIRSGLCPSELHLRPGYREVISYNNRTQVDAAAANRILKRCDHPQRAIAIAREWSRGSSSLAAAISARGSHFAPRRITLMLGHGKRDWKGWGGYWFLIFRQSPCDEFSERANWIKFLGKRGVAILSRPQMIDCGVMGGSPRCGPNGTR